MHRIDTSGSIDGRFQDGNPAIGQLATQLDASWFNDLQDNLFALLAEAHVAPTKGRALDVLDAVKVIAGGVGGGGGGGAGSVPTTRKLSASGLLTTTGEDLSQDRTLSVPAASAAEVVAGQVDTKAITPKALADAMNGAIGAYSVQIGPLIFKAGKNLGVMSQGSVFTPFPVAFPNECWFAGPVARNDSAGRARDTWVQLVGAPSKDGFTVCVQDSSSGGGNTIDGFDWWAFGR